MTKPNMTQTVTQSGNGSTINQAGGDIKNERLGVADHQASQAKSRASSDMEDVVLAVIHEEEELGRAIKKQLDPVIRPHKVVLLSDATPVGESQASILAKVLPEAKVVIGVASGQSLTRPWWSYAMGAAGAQNKPTILLCHGEASAKTVPPPFLKEQAIDLPDINSFHLLLKKITGQLGIGELPSLDYAHITLRIQETINRLNGPGQAE